MVRKPGLYDYRVLVSAMALSLVWHCFWLTAVRVVASPAPSRPVKFSRVSFLGTILTRGAIEVRVDTKERSFLEKRYMENVVHSSMAGTSGAGSSHLVRALTGGDTAKSAGGELSLLIDEAISGEKMEPLPDSE